MNEGVVTVERNRRRLPKRDMERLRRVERTHPSPRVRWRAHLVLAWAKGASLRAVAQDHDCHWHTVKEAVCRYQTGKVQGLADASRPGRPRQVPPEVRAHLAQALEATPQGVGIAGYRWTADRVRRYLARHHCLRVSPRTARREIQRCGKVRKRGKHYVSSPDPLYRQKKGR